MGVDFRAATLERFIWAEQKIKVASTAQKRIFWQFKTTQFFTLPASDYFLEG
jgi:hypothetical protein